MKKKDKYLRATTSLHLTVKSSLMALMNINSEESHSQGEQDQE